MSNQAEIHVSIKNVRNPSADEWKLFTAARAILVHHEVLPELAQCIYNLHPLSVDNIPTIAVDKNWRLYINFEWFSNASHAERTVALAHECWHMLCNHVSTIPDENPDKANIYLLCADAEINDGLRDTVKEHAFLSKVGRMIDGAVYPSNLPAPCDDHHTADFYYNAQDLTDHNCPTCNGSGIQQDSDENQNQDGDQDSDENQNQDGDQDGESGQDGDQDGESGQDGDQDGESGQQGQKPCPDCSGSGVNGATGSPMCSGGSGAGRSLPGEISAEGKIDGQEVPSVDEGLSESIRQQVAQEIIEKYQGTGSANLEWAIGQKKKYSNTDWRKELRAGVVTTVNNKRGHSVRSFSRPARRNMNSRNMVMPSRLDMVSDVLIGVDTSGSMGDDDFAHVAGELDIILSRHKGKVGSFSIDGEVKANTVQIMRKVKEMKLSGGGGTDMRLGFEFISQYKERMVPAVGVIMTDGYTPWPDANWFKHARNAKGQPIRWIVIGTHADAGQYEEVKNIPQVKVIVVKQDENH